MQINDYDGSVSKINSDGQTKTVNFVNFDI